MLQHRAAAPEAGRTAFTFLEDGERASGILTFADLDLRARQVAARLQRHTHAGDRVLLVHPPGLDYIAAFFGCLYAGVIAVPALPPSSLRTLPRLKLMAQDAQPRLALAPGDVVARMRAAPVHGDGGFGQLEWLDIDAAGDADAAQEWVRPDVAAGDIAFLQYTSGSTAAPKGVMVSHANLLANARLMQSVYGMGADDTFVSWLPPHHDLGLIGGIVLPLYVGCHCVQFPPAAFLMRPHRWLKVLSDYRACVTGAPDFAYALCADKVTEAQKRGLDLSALEVAVNGAERVRHATLRRFAQAFAGCGLRPQALTPSYGLAESTLLVTASRQPVAGLLPPHLAVDRQALAMDRVEPAADGEDKPGTIALVGTGASGLQGHAVRIVDPVSLCELPQGKVGEIWVSGPSVAQGYWQRAEETARTFGARLPGHAAAHLRTGDLGFLHQGALYVTGRLKEMMVFSGENIYPQDVEATVEALDPAFRAGGCAVFCVDDEDGKPKLVVVQELESRRQAALDTLAGELRAALQESHGIVDLAALLLVKAGHVPRTSSGKIQRVRCRQMFLDGELEAAWSWREDAEGAQGARASEKPLAVPRTPTETALAGIWRELLDLDAVDVDTSFLALGGHSLLAAQIVARVREVFDVEVDIRALFEFPTVGGLAGHIDLQQGRCERAAPLAAIAPAPRGDALPLSFAQRRLWFLDQFEGASAAYNIAAALRLTGALDARALERALDEVMRRHEVLRTHFASGQGEPVQRIESEARLRLWGDDLSGLPVAERTARARQLAQEEGQAPFDLQTGPLLRARLVKLDVHEHMLLVTVHHIVSDGWSMGVLVREVAVLYAAFVKGEQSPLPELPIQYADYAHWQRQWLGGAVLEQQLGYWKERLQGAPALLALPTDRLRPAVQSHVGSTVRFALRQPVRSALKQLARDSQATLFMVLMAGWSLLLGRYTGQGDICVGTPVANRTRPETAGLIGLFANTLVLRTEVDAGADFTQLLAQVRGHALDAYAHQDMPFEQLVEALRPERHTSHAPLVQVTLALQDARPALRLPGLQVELVPSDSVAAKFDLSLDIVPGEDGCLHCSIDYRADLFDRETILRMAGHFETLLESAVAAPLQPLRALPMLDAAEREALVAGWSAARAQFAANHTLQALFEAQVQRTPKAVAVRCEGEALRYGELNARANRLAHHLRRQGVGPDMLVGLCVERGLEMVVGLLAILKAGGAYVPLDPDYPAERLAFMLADARPALVLTQQKLLERLPRHDVALKTFCLDSEWHAVQGEPDGNPSPVNLPQHLAYVIYTSGSTGRPKGALLQHGNVVRLFEAARAHFDFGADDVWTLFHSYAFDFSVWELWGALLYGGRLVVVPHAVARSPEQFLQLLAREAVTVLNQTPSAFHALVQAEQRQALPLNLRHVIFGGEALNRASLAPWFARHGDETPRLANMYGITETTVHVTHHRLRDAATAAAGCIGQPLADLGCYLLDETLEPVPVGVPGELYVAGAGLARGYLNRPGLTAEKFLPDPYGPPGTRMYRTGDRARAMADGGIDYLGRIDQQVKIRGFRIELGEIEAALVQQPGVREALVLAREDMPGDKRLVAYVVGDALDAETLRAGLLRSLPQYMVPAHYVPLPALPLNANGKVDRKALPVPDANAASSRAYEAPRTATEQALAGIWAQLLGLDKVGVHDDFFALGGHSLLATQVVSKLRTACGVELPLRALFETPRLADLAARVDQARAEEEGRVSEPILPVPRDAPPPLSFAQQRLWFLDQLEGASAFYNIAAALRMTGALNRQALERALHEVVCRHEVLRTAFASEQGEPVQRIKHEAGLRLRFNDLTALPAGERAAHAQWLAQDEAQTPFDLQTCPLLRAGLVKLDVQEHVLLFTVHHIVSDGWSMGVLVREVAALYGAYVAGQDSPLPELPIQYADYAYWQWQWLSGAVLEQQLGYWKERLQGAPTLLALPTDRPRPAVQSHAGATLKFTVPATTAAALYALGRETQTTLFMALATAFSVLLNRYTGQDDICIGTPIANRNRAEIEPLIGFFVNTLVLRTQVDGRQSVAELLEQVKTHALGAYAHQDIPFEHLVEALNPQRSTSHTPLFQAMLVLQNAPMGELRLPGLKLEPVESEHATAKFDLTLTVVEAEQELHASLEYATELFDQETIERMARHLQRLLEAIAENAQSRIADLPMLGQEEEHQLLRQWNATQVEYAAEATLQQLFEAQASRTPNAVAVRYENEELSYAELNQRANRLAHHLGSQGVGPDVLVGIRVERSLEMVIGLLAILKAGGAYVPLDSDYPPERLAFMLADAQPVLVLTQERLREAMCLDGYPEHNPLVRVLPQHLAYVIYTSGSTGKPKGIGIQHGNAAAFVAWARSVFTQAELERTLASTSICFDLSVFELFVPLCSGGSVWLVKDILDLVSRPGAFPVTLVNTVPSAIAQLHASRAIPASAKVINLAGEALAPALVDALYRSEPVEQIFNLYGPSEDTTYSTYALLDRDSSTVGIGRPVANTQVYLLDVDLNLVPVGVAGELCIAGVGLARGYLHRPALTAEKFIPNPHGTPGTRMYRTGDLARWRRDGSIDYLGRIDHQVKIRGFRIELGEIEAVLAQHPGVREALVLAREDAPGDKRLVAYVVGDALEAEALRAGLKRSLPQYMVPAHYVVLQQLPLGPNGKVDRKALPGPEASRGEARYEAPRTATEEAVADIWAQVLRLGKVGVHDDFFALGGHSLLATQVVSKLRAACRVELPLRALFEAPTVAELAARVDQARAEDDGPEGEPIIPVPRDTPLPLSFAQQRLWFLDQLEPGTGLYNIAIALGLCGHLDHMVLRATLNEVVRRHEALRTRFGLHGGEPVQLIAPQFVLDLPLADLSALPPEQGAREARLLAQDEAAQAFDLATGPLVRARLLKLAEEEHVLLFTVHHIVADGWSMGVLVREVGALYAAYAQGRPTPLQELPVQYADFAHWQRHRLGAAILQDQLRYWEQALDGALALLALPTDRPRPAAQSHRGATHRTHVDPRTTERLRALGQAHQSTLFMTLAAAFSVLLSRYAGQDEVCIGTPIANRTRAELEGLVGFFVNTLVLRTRVRADGTFEELLAQVRASTLGAYAHQDLPFEQLVEALKPQRSAAHAPLFQAMLVLQNAPLDALQLPGLALRVLDSESVAAKFDLTLNVVEQRDGLALGFEYATDLLDAATIERMARHFVCLLEGIAQAPRTPVHALALLDAQERQQILQQWNATRQDYPRDASIQALFEAQARRTPDAPALQCEGEQLSYAQLDARANQLAHHLRSRGVGPDVLVGVCMERSLRMVVGFLAILKAGGAYLPLDPGEPSERLAAMLDDARPALVLTQERMLPLLAAAMVEGLDTFCMDSQWHTLDAQSTAHPTAYSGSIALPGQLAYVIYTSGSTGRPKGVAVPHRAVLRLVLDNSYAPLGPADCVAHCANPAFDAATWEIWGALLNGARLLVVPASVVLDAPALCRELLAAGTTALWLTVGLFNEYADALAPAFARLRHLLVGGEAVDAKKAARVLNGGSAPRHLVNGYGPTETTTFAATFPIRALPDSATTVPIGRPIANTQVYLLDTDLEPVPVGVTGELYIGGDGLARGYLNRPALTAEKFIPNPFGAPGTRLYRSGDLARYLSDGNIDYLGRIDHQVKIRGFRIELGEVEAALAAQPGVREALVLAREDVPGDKRLVAYVVGDGLDVQALRAALLRSLPHYMVPAHYVPLPAFPLNANGKVDRKALPPPDANAASARTYEAPRTPTEETLAAIWAQVLGLEKVGVHDDFFALGGHSLLATQVVAQLRAAFEVELALRAFFETPTIAAMAETIDAEKQAFEEIDL
ncbi:MAG: amino acid adenylation domain-containing protein [Pseudomonadota bacterium]